MNAHMIRAVSARKIGFLFQPEWRSPQSLWNMRRASGRSVVMPTYAAGRNFRAAAISWLQKTLKCLQQIFVSSFGSFAELYSYRCIKGIADEDRKSTRL